MRTKTILLILLLLFSCVKKSIKREYYSNGNIKKVEYGNDSITLFFEKYKNIPKAKITPFNDSLYNTIYYYRDGHKRMEGLAYGDEKKIGKWHFYSQSGNKDGTVEYTLVNNNSYVNQKWLLDKSGDTLVNSNGNFYQTNIKEWDTVIKNESFKVQFSLIDPYFSSQSRFYLCLPKNDSKLRYDFSNERNILWDTIQSVSESFPNRKNLQLYNHDAVFNLFPESFGKKVLRGILIEDNGIEHRKQYFTINYFVKDKR